MAGLFRYLGQREHALAEVLPGGVPGVEILLVQVFHRLHALSEVGTLMAGGPDCAHHLLVEQFVVESQCGHAGPVPLAPVASRLLLRIPPDPDSNCTTDGDISGASVA